MIANVFLWPIGIIVKYQKKNGDENAQFVDIWIDFFFNLNQLIFGQNLGFWKQQAHKESNMVKIFPKSV